MSRSKKILGLVLALALVFGCVTMAFAAIDSSSKATVAISVDKTELKAGETAQVTVKATTNFPAAGVSIPVFYDKTLVEVSDLDASATGLGSKISAITEAESGMKNKVYANTGLDEAKFGFVFVTYMPVSNEEVDATNNAKTVLTFTVTAKADVSGDALVQCVAGSLKTTSNTNGTLYFGGLNKGNVLNENPVNVENIDITAAKATITVVSEAAGPNTLVVKDDAPSTPYIDTVNNCGYDGSIYGIDTLGWNDDLESEGALADFLTTELGDEYLQITTPDCGEETTGTIIEVLNADGSVAETYVFIYFGDIDENGEINADDGYMANHYGLFYDGIDTLEQLMAGDLDGDLYPTADDGYVMSYYGMNYMGMPTQQEVAEMVFEQPYELI